jgi:hypothetical protein
MYTLCEQIAIEKDQDKFSQLIHELNDLLERKERRLESGNPPRPSPGKKKSA